MRRRLDRRAHIHQRRIPVDRHLVGGVTAEVVQVRQRRPLGGIRHLALLGILLPRLRAADQPTRHRRFDTIGLGGAVMDMHRGALAYSRNEGQPQRIAAQDVVQLRLRRIQKLPLLRQPVAL
ncbi:hypothetical protein XAUB_06490 [Xanthomonas citri pv. aurantifolii str. ICPB 11122]|nr:hypothetical protein XAUB_06490 [Xanthomonas citri pv. aurantifolii str. ICPB 11122]